eukprot:scaffold96995_cov21-Tisochrysis_lutea.AAC.2
MRCTLRQSQSFLAQRRYLYAVPGASRGPSCSRPCLALTCIAECTLCEHLLPYIACLLPLDSQQQTMHQRLPYPHIRARV